MLLKRRGGYYTHNNQSGKEKEKVFICRMVVALKGEANTGQKIIFLRRMNDKSGFRGGKNGLP